MGVAVLPPQDCLRDGVFHHRRLISPPRSKPRRAPNPSPAHNRSGRRKHRSPSGSPPPPQTKPQTQPLSGPIRILKRGEDLPHVTIPTAASLKTVREGSVERANSDPTALSTRPKTPEPVPAPIPNLFVAGFYAGSAFSTSPPPSSLPLPGFCTKAVGMSKSTAEDVVALDLRRILRIDFS